MLARAISISYGKLFKTSYEQNRSESGVGVYQFSQIRSHTGARGIAFVPGAEQLSKNPDFAHLRYRDGSS